MAQKRGNVRGRAKRIKHSRSKSSPTEVVYHSTKEIKVERALIDNFIGLQKVMVGLSAKFDSLTSQISNLLQIFEVSARELAKKEVSVSSNLDAKKVMEKLDVLSAQAGLIGRGLALIHEVGTETRKPATPTFNIPVNKPAAQPATSAAFSSPFVKSTMTGMTEPQQKMTKEVPEASNENVLP